MIKSGENIQSFYNSNILQIKVNKRTNNTNSNTKNNSPKNVSSHQENNYYYNTKINRLILQEAPNNNQIQNIYQQQESSNKSSILIEYDLLANNINNILPQKKQMQSLYKKNKNNNIQNMPITVNIQKKINENDMNNLYQKDINGFNCISINRTPNINTNNVFNNYKKDSNYRKFNEYKDRIINSNYIKNNNNDSYQIMNINIMQNSANMNDSKTKSYFYHNNNENNNNDFKYSSNNILQKNIIINSDINNKTMNCKKIPIRKEKVGNYYIRNPGIISIERNHGTNRKNNNIKSRYKSPEILIGNNKLKKGNFSTIQNDNENEDGLLNNDSSGYTSGFGFYKKKDEFNKNNSVNNNNNLIHKNKTSDNINKSRSVFKHNNNLEDINNNNLEKKLNPSNDIYSKIKPKNYYKFRGINEKSKSKDKEKEKEKEKTNNLSLSESKINNINNFKTYIKNKLKDYNSMKTKIEEFCENLEQIYFISFKKSFNFFIQNLKLLYQQKGSNRAIILKRFKKEKSNRYNNSNVKINNSMININNKIKNEIKNESERIKSIDIGHEYKKGIIEMEDNNDGKNKSPTKFIELQNNIAKSMMKINQDNYIKMFNNIFNKKNINNERYRSPLIDKANINIDNDSIKYSFEENNKEKVKHKYSTNTNVHPHFQRRIFNKKFNKLNINIAHNNDSEMRNCLRTSLNTENASKIELGYKSNIIKMKKLSEFNNEYSFSNNINSININSIENNINDINNEYFYKQKILEQNQKYNISNTIDPNKYNQRGESDERKYRKIKKKIVNQKNNLLYSKPLLKKSIAKFIDQESNNNNILELELKRNDNNQAYNSKSNTINNLKNANNTQVYDIKTFKEEIRAFKNIDEIIVKNVGTEDKRLHVFIKYIILENFGTNHKDRLLSKLLNMENKIKYKNFDQNKFINKHTDSIALNNNDNDNDNENNEKICIKNSKILNNTKDKYFNDQQNNDNDKKEIEINYKKIKDNKRKVLTSIGEEEEKLKNKKEYLENSEEDLNNSDMDDEIKNSINYLISLLQNVYDDTKKSILYSFFKNLKKIKTNSLLHKAKNIKSDLNINNVIDMKRNRKIKDKYLQKNISSRNTENVRQISEDENNNRYNASQEVHMGENINENNLFRNNKKSIDNEDKDINNKKESLLGSIRELKEEAIKFRKKKSERSIVDKYKDKDDNIKEIDEIKENESKTIEEEKDDIRKKKLAKLGKLFNNLNQENNIINAIKEQFLDWTSKNDFPKREKFGKRKIDDDLTNNKVKNKEYGVKTFNMKFKFNRDVYIENETEIYEQFKRKLKIFRNKLISYSIKNNNKERDINSESNNENNRFKDDDDY